MRLGVVEEKGVLEFFIASTEMELITGLLEEFEDRLDRKMRGSFTADARMEIVHDEGVRKHLEHRPLLLYTAIDETEIGTVDQESLILGSINRP
jgi:hypothetical protein